MDQDSKLKLTDDAKQALKRMRIMEPLVGWEAWKELEIIAKAQIENHRKKLDAPALSIKEEKAQNYIKGIIFGIDLMIQTPSRIIADGKDIQSKIARLGGTINE